MLVNYCYGVHVCRLRNQNAVECVAGKNMSNIMAGLLVFPLLLILWALNDIAAALRMIAAALRNSDKPTNSVRNK